MRPLLLVLIPLTLVSCRPQIQQKPPLVDYAQQLLADRTSREAALLEASKVSLPESEISIIGESRECESLCDYLLSYDAHDNIDASLNPDQLPDFAGESINSLFISIPEDSTQLRTLIVQSLISSLDSIVYLSPYDELGVCGKKSSKLVILSNPKTLQYGKYDADSLLSSYSSSVKLLSSLDLMMEQAFEKRQGEDIHIAIVCEKGYSDSQVYESVFARKARQKTLSHSSCHVVEACQGDSLMHHIVSTYLTSGHERKIDALIVDACSVDVEMLKSELAGMLSVMNASSMLYSHIFSPCFSVIDARKTVAEYCYSLLREYNLFTHNISLPQSQNFSCYGRDGKTILISSTYVQN